MEMEGGQMAVSKKSKKELVEEINALKSRLKELEHNEAKLSKAKQVLKKTQDVPLEEGVRISDIDIEWKRDKGLCTFEKLPIAMMWINSTLAGLMSGVQAMVGTERFRLALQSEGRKSVEDDWQVLSQFSDFNEGFKAIANIAAVAGWGDWKLIDIDEENKECLFRVWNSWEGQYQKALGVCWGSGMLAGKLAGYCSRLFETNCWAEQSAFVARGDQFDEFRVHVSERSIEKEIENLLATDEATRADMAVALQKLQQEISTRKQAQDAMKKSSIIIDSTIDAVVTTDIAGNITFWNKGAEIIYGYRKEEVIGKPVSIFYKDQDLHILNSMIKDLLKGKDIPGIEITCIDKNKQDIEVLISLASIRDKDGNVTELVGITKDITERKQQENLTVIQRDLAMKLGAAMELEDGLSLCLEAAIKASEMDCGGIYLIDEDSGALKLAFHKGLSSEFVNGVSIYNPDSDNARIVMKGEPVYTEYEQLGVLLERGETVEGLHSLAVLPVINEGRVIGCLNIASHIIKQIPAWSRLALETIAAQIGSTVTRLETAEALRESEERSRLAVQAARLCTWDLDINAGEVYLSSDSTELLKLAPEIESIPVNYLWEYIIPEDLERVQQAMEQAINERALYNDEHRIKRPDGTECWIASWGQPVYDKTGKAIRMIGVSQDITERKKAEGALRQSEERFKILYESAPDAYYIHDLEGYFIDGNNAAEELVGYKKEEAIGKSFFELGLVANEDIPKIDVTMADNKDGKPAGPLDLTARRKDGSKVFVETRSYPVEIGGQTVVLGIARDITERKKAEEALRESEEKFRSGFEHAAVGRGIVGLDGIFLNINSSFCEMLGYSENELLEITWMDITYPDDVKAALENDRQLMEGKIPSYRYIHRLIKKNGNIIWVDLNVVLVSDSKGRPLYMIADIINITEQTRLQEAYQSLVDNSLQGLTIIQDGRMVFVNKAFSSTTGYSEQELLAASPEKLSSLVHPDDREKVWSRHQDRLERKPVPHRYEFRWIRKDGSVAWVEIHANQIEYQGRPAIQAAYIDITERRKTEQALRQSEERLKILFESAPDAFYLNDLKGNFVDGNKATEQMLGYTKAELQGKSFIETELLSLEQAQKVTANLKMIAMGKPTGPDEFTLTRKDGTGVDVEIRTFPVSIGNRMLSLGIARDISVRKITDRKLIEHQAQLKSLASELSLTEERERHRLATELHDQIGQVLIFSRIKLQELHASLSSEEIAKPLQEVSQNLDRIIQDTRTLTFDLSSPILYELGFEAAVAEWLEEQIGKKHGIKTQFIDDGRPKPLEEDIRILLFRNVRELLVNVVKHANAQNVKVTIRRIRKQINVSVEDDGVGFNPAETTSSRGFGIFSVRERLEQLAGNIQIRSESGQGSKIVMMAPLKRSKKKK